MALDGPLGSFVPLGAMTRREKAKSVVTVSDFSKKIEFDNKISDNFIFQINSIEDQNDLVGKIGISRKKYYTSLAFNSDGSPNKNYKFLNGWISRVDRCLDYKGQS